MGIIKKKSPKGNPGSIQNKHVCDSVEIWNYFLTINYIAQGEAFCILGPCSVYFPTNESACNISVCKFITLSVFWHE